MTFFDIYSHRRDEGATKFVKFWRHVSYPCAMMDVDARAWGLYPFIPFDLVETHYVKLDKGFGHSQPNLVSFFTRNMGFGSLVCVLTMITRFFQNPKPQNLRFNNSHDETSDEGKLSYFHKKPEWKIIHFLDPRMAFCGKSKTHHPDPYAYTNNTSGSRI